MEFDLSESSAIKTLARVFQSASKVGDDLMIASVEDGIQMRTLNASHSTCAQFNFHRSFFDRIKLPRTQLDLKLPARALLPVFRSPGGIASVRMQCAPDESSLIFTCITTKTRLKKTYHVPVLEGRLGVTVFSKESCTCMLQTRARFFLDMLTNFHGKLDEITFTPSPHAMRIASFVDDAAASASNRMLRTEMTVDAREFEVHRFTKEHDVVLTIFCKYFRAVLEFCDHFECPMHMWYESSGMPLMFDLEIAGPGAEPHFEAQFVFATRHVDDFTQRPAATVSPTSTSPRPPNDSWRPSRGSGRGSAPQRRARPPLPHNSLPPLPTPSPPATQSPQSTQSPPRSQLRSPVSAGLPLPSGTEPVPIIPDSGPSHVSDTPAGSMDVDEEIRHHRQISRTPVRKPPGVGLRDPQNATLSNSVSPLRKRADLFGSQNKTPQSAQKSASHGSILDDSVPETPLVDPQSQSRAHPTHGTLFDPDESSDDFEDGEFVEGTPPPQ